MDPSGRNEERGRIVEGEIVEGEVVQGPRPRRTFFHPYSGLVILGVDWLAFGLGLPLPGLLTPVMCLAAFGATFWAVLRLQLRQGDVPGWAYLKAFFGALAAGVPFPITGTVVGAAILMLSGLPTDRKR